MPPISIITATIKMIRFTPSTGIPEFMIQAYARVRRPRSVQDHPMFHLLRSIWIWTASAALILAWTPLLGIIWLFDRDPMRLRTGRWFRRLGRGLAKINPWRIHISGLENLHAN